MAVTVAQVLVTTEIYAKIRSDGGQTPAGMSEKLSLSLNRIRRLIALAARRADLSRRERGPVSSVSAIISELRRTTTAPDWNVVVQDCWSDPTNGGKVSYATMRSQGNGT